MKKVIGFVVGFLAGYIGIAIIAIVILLATGGLKFS